MLQHYCNQTNVASAGSSLQAMREAAAALARARPGLPVYDRRRKVEWALRLQQRWLRRVLCSCSCLHKFRVSGADWCCNCACSMEAEGCLLAKLQFLCRVL
jgi:hypothetical protein